MLLSMALFLRLFQSQCSLSLPAGAGSSARVVQLSTLCWDTLCFSNTASPAGGWAPEGVLDSPALGRRSWQPHRASRMSFTKPGKKSPPAVWCSVPRPSSFQPRQAGWVSHKSLSAPFIRQPKGLLLSDARHLLPPHACFLPAPGTRGCD